MPGLLDFISLKDMIDGGGAGRAGQTFEGGGLSPILNSLGIRPMGFMERQAAARPMARPMGSPTMSSSGPAAQPPMPAMPPMGQITQTALPPPGQMSNEDLIRMLLQALQSAPSATGYGPR